ALSCMTTTIDRGRKIARDYKRARNARGLEARTIVGGIHASMLPDDVSNDFDQVFVGECDKKTLLGILSGEIVDKVIHGHPLENLDELPFPDFTLIKDRSQKGSIPVMTSMGCPHDCEFCSVVPMFGRKVRTRSSENLLEELKQYKEGNIFFVDDNFTANPKRLESLLDDMIASGFSRPWSAQSTVRIGKRPNLAAKMKQAGCWMGYFGFEGVTDEALRALGKPQTVADIEAAIGVFHENDMYVLGMFMAGMDPDTLETFKEITEFCKRNKVDFFQLMALSPLPGSRLHARYEKEGRILTKDWRQYDGLHVVNTHPNMTPTQWQEGIIQCYEDFYRIGAFPRILLRSYRDLPTNPYPLYPAVTRVLGKYIVKRWKLSEANQKYRQQLEATSKRVKDYFS
ncbi:MAG: B12-binding domain-containing radical SAM protein, partial [Nanoarchaeota archaeon]|nr:B12-binding domain-containing radical SAM protein [Nanoarchaeota archaeon]